MSGGLESIERAINDADQKFREKLDQCKNGATPNLSVLADRTFNLRQQVVHNATLMSDQHFVELLDDVEMCLTPEYTLRGDIDRKLEAFLAGLLKSILRDTVAVQSFAVRKVQIEMTWHWHRDKKEQILDYALEKRRPSTAPHAVGGEAQPSQEEMQLLAEKKQQHESGTERSAEATCRAASAASAKLRKLHASQQAREKQTTARALGGGKSSILGFAAEAQKNTDQAAIAKKLALYKKPNLSRSECYRCNVREELAKPGTTRNDAIRVVYTKRYKEKQQQQAQQKESERRLPGVGGIRARGEEVSAPSGPTPYRHVTNASAPRFNPPRSDLPPKPETASDVLATVNQRIVSHLVRGVEEEHEEREMHDAQSVLAFQQSRLEEETARRIESSDIAGQAGRTCHNILRRVPRQKGEPPVTAKSQLPSAALEHSEVMDHLGRVVSRAEGSLSAHDHYLPNAIDEQRLQDILTRIASKDDEPKTVSARERFGLVSPHRNNIAGTGLRPGTLEVQTTASTATAPVMPRGDVPLAELLDPVLEGDTNVPSTQRLQQLKLVDRVRDCFARARTKGGAPIHVPRSVIEGALLTPDDRTFEECMRLLPAPGSGFPSNPNPDVGKDKKKGKKGKKGDAKNDKK